MMFLAFLKFQNQDREGEHTFEGRLIEVDHACLTDPKYPQLTEEM